jgi:hypothetical protein
MFSVSFDTTKVDDNFARVFRIKTWKEFLRQPTPRIMYESTYNYPTTIKKEKGFSILINYESDNLQDMDFRISEGIDAGGVISVIAAGELTGGDITRTSQMLSKREVAKIFDQVWENLIEPKAD